MSSHRFHFSLVSCLAAALLSACGPGELEGSSPEEPLDDTPTGFIAQGVGTPALARWFTFQGQDHIAQVELASNQDGSLALFERTSAGALRFSKQTSPNSGWAPVQSLDGADMRDIAVAQNADGRLEVYVLLNLGSIYYRSQSAPNSTSWNNWLYAGGTSLQDIAVGRNLDGRLQLFAVGGDWRIYERHQAWPGGSLTDWSFQGGTNIKQIKVESDASGRLVLFGLSLAGEPYVSQQVSVNGAFGGWSGIGWIQGTDLEVTRGSDGRLEAVLSHATGGLFHLAQVAPNGAWGSLWSSLGTSPVRGSYDLVPGPNGALHVFASYGTPQGVYYGYRSGPTAALTWQGLLGGTRSGLSAARNLDGRLELFSVESESSPRTGRIFQTWQTATGGPWVSPPPPQPAFGSFSTFPSLRPYGSGVSERFSASSTGCSFLTVTVDSTPVDAAGNSTGATTRVYNRSVATESLSDAYSFTLNNDVRLDFTATCDDSPTEVGTSTLRVTKTSEYQSTLRIPLPGVAGSAPTLFTNTVNLGLDGSALLLSSPQHASGNYSLSLIPPGAPSSTCWTQGSVILAPGGSTQTADLVKLYGTEFPAFPLTIRACANSLQTGAPLDTSSLVDVEVTYRYYQ